MNVLRLDDIYQRETQNRLVLHNLDWRLQRLETVNMNMCRMMQQMFDQRSFVRSPHLVRSSSLSPKEFEPWKVPNAFREPSSELPSERKLSTRRTTQLTRRSTIHRLNSSVNKEANHLRFQPNEYISITDGSLRISLSFSLRHPLILCNF